MLFPPVGVGTERSQNSTAQPPKISFLISRPNHYILVPETLVFWPLMADRPSAAPPPMSYSEDTWPLFNAHARRGTKTTYRPMNKLSLAPLLLPQWTRTGALFLPSFSPVWSYSPAFVQAKSFPQLHYPHILYIWIQHLVKSFCNSGRSLTDKLFIVIINYSKFI